MWSYPTFLILPKTPTAFDVGLWASVQTTLVVDETLTIAVFLVIWCPSIACTKPFYRFWMLADGAAICLYTILSWNEFAVKWMALYKNKAGYTATPVACGWAGAVLEKVPRAFGQER